MKVELEYYEHGQLVAYPLFEEVEDGDVSEPIFSIHDSTPESALLEFPAHGFVSPDTAASPGPEDPRRSAPRSRPRTPG